MKATGARIVPRTPILAMCFSTSYFLSKCGTPVCRLAEPTEVKTRCAPADLAASAAAIPRCVSASVSSDGTVTANREVAPSSAFRSAAVSSSDAVMSSAPALASNFAYLEFASRVTARTLCPCARSPRATAPPCLPVEPVTTTVSFCVMFFFLFAAGQTRGCKCDWNKPENAGRTSMKMAAHNRATKRANGSPLGAMRAWKARMLTITGASTATANGT